MSTFKLNNGNEIPAIGLGTWQAANEGEAYTAVLAALKLGYRHIDTAAGYRNEEDVGRAIKDSGVAREEIFVTTKLPGESHQDPEAALDESLKKLGLDYVDLYLIHWPIPQDDAGALLPNWTFIDTYKKFQHLPVAKAKSLGVSNFSVKNLTALFADKDVTKIPAVNQVELHPYLPQPKLLEYCRKKGILLEAYSPLGSTGTPLIKSKTVLDMAEKYKATPVQVLINWAIWRGTVVLPKSVTPARIESNFKEFKLDDADGVLIDQTAEKEGSKRYCDGSWAPINVFNDDE